MKKAACPLLLSGSMGPDVDAILRSNHKRMGSPAIPRPWFPKPASLQTGKWREMPGILIRVPLAL